MTNKYSPNDVFNKSGTLYCGYIGLEYKVTLDVNGGEALSQSEYIISSGSSVNVLPIPTRKYYNFIGWSIDGSEEISPVFNYAKDVTLKAIWRNKTSTITYDSAGGIIYNGETPIVGNYSTQTVTHGTEFIPYVAKKDGYTFLGWKVSDTEILSGGIWDYDGNLSVTATYESN